MVPTHSFDCKARTIPTRCSWCNSDVFFFWFSCGFRVYFDDFGVPWPKHGCDAYRNVRAVPMSGGSDLPFGAIDIECRFPIAGTTSNTQIGPNGKTVYRPVQSARQTVRCIPGRSSETVTDLRHHPARQTGRSVQETEYLRGVSRQFVSSGVR